MLPSGRAFAHQNVVICARMLSGPQVSERMAPPPSAARVLTHPDPS